VIDGEMQLLNEVSAARAPANARTRNAERFTPCAAIICELLL
jgi:hypothetical protein